MGTQVEKKFRTIATHTAPHLDELVAICLLKKFGDKKFPGVKRARTIYWNTGGGTPGGRTVEEYEQEGVLIVGMCGSRFDEHSYNGETRKKGVCATTLVAKYLEIDDDPALDQILKFVVNEDTKGYSTPFSVAHIIKLLHQQYPDNPSRVVRWALEAIEAKYNEQMHFFSTTEAEFDKKAKVVEVKGLNGKTLKVVFVESDSHLMNQFARSEYGCRADVVVQKTNTGNVQIFTNSKSRLLIFDIAQIVRFKEQELKGEVFTDDWKLLASEGKIRGAEEWYFHYEGQMLLNGSLTAKGVPPTHLNLDQLEEITKIGLNPLAFETKRSPDCQRGICTSTPKEKCPWYAWGLQRCRKIRFDMRKR